MFMFLVSIFSLRVILNRTIRRAALPYPKHGCRMPAPMRSHGKFITYSTPYKIPLRNVGDVKSRGCRKSKRYTPVTPSCPMLEQKRVILLLLLLLLNPNPATATTTATATASVKGSWCMVAFFVFSSFASYSCL